MASGSALAAFSCEDSPALIWVAKTYAVPPMLVISPSTGVVIVTICVPVVKTNVNSCPLISGDRRENLKSFLGIPICEKRYVLVTVSTGRVRVSSAKTLEIMELSMLWINDAATLSALWALSMTELCELIADAAIGAFRTTWFKILRLIRRLDALTFGRKTRNDCQTKV